MLSPSIHLQSYNIYFILTIVFQNNSLQYRCNSILNTRTNLRYYYFVAKLVYLIQVLLTHV